MLPSKLDNLFTLRLQAQKLFHLKGSINQKSRKARN